MCISYSYLSNPVYSVHENNEYTYPILIILPGGHSIGS